MYCTCCNRTGANGSCCCGNTAASFCSCADQGVTARFTSCPCRCCCPEDPTGEGTLRRCCCSCGG